MSSFTSDQIREGILKGVPYHNQKDGTLEIRPLIHPFDYDFIEGGSADLSIDQLFLPYPKTSNLVMPGQNPKQQLQVYPVFIGKQKRVTPEIKECEPVEFEGVKGFPIFPGHYYLVKTVETLNIPNDVRALVSSRTTLFRCGLNLICAPVHPGYSGQLTFGLSNPSPIPVVIEHGARIASVTFWTLCGSEKDAYSGVWQGGLVSTEGNVVRAF
jgi:deoxycytidine triphosphate deaminase